MTPRPSILRSAARSDVGLRVPRRQRGLQVRRRPLLVVADGMGGHAAGADVTLRAAIATMSETETTGNADQALERLSEAVVTIGRAHRRPRRPDPEWAGMAPRSPRSPGWAATRARRGAARRRLARAYLVRDGEFTQITRDHTYVQTLIDSGRISPEETAVHPRRNLLMRAIDGVHPAGQPDVSVRRARAATTSWSAATGLSGYVSDERVHELLGLCRPDPPP